jgi:hypothetical protein
LVALVTALGTAAALPAWRSGWHTEPGGNRRNREGTAGRIGGGEAGGGEQTEQ